MKRQTEVTSHMISRTFKPKFEKARFPILTSSTTGLRATYLPVFIYKEVGSKTGMFPSVVLASSSKTMFIETVTSVPVAEG